MLFQIWLQNVYFLDKKTRSMSYLYSCFDILRQLRNLLADSRVTERIREEDLYCGLKIRHDVLILSPDVIRNKRYIKNLVIVGNIIGLFQLLTFDEVNSKVSNCLIEWQYLLYLYNFWNVYFIHVFPSFTKTVRVFKLIKLKGISKINLIYI